MTAGVRRFLSVSPVERTSWVLLGFAGFYWELVQNKRNWGIAVAQGSAVTSPCPSVLVLVSLCPCVSVSSCPCVPVSPCPCVPVSPCPHVPVSLCPCVPVSPCPCDPVSPCLRVPVSCPHVPVPPYPRVPVSLCPHIPMPSCPRVPVSLSPPCPWWPEGNGHSGMSPRSWGHWDNKAEHPEATATPRWGGDSPWSPPEGTGGPRGARGHSRSVPRMRRVGTAGDTAGLSPAERWLLVSCSCSCRNRIRCWSWDLRGQRHWGRGQRQGQGQGQD